MEGPDRHSPTGLERWAESRIQNIHFHHLRHVLVSSSGDADDDDVVTLPLPALLRDPGYGMRGFQRRNDALEPRERREPTQRVGIRDRDVPRASRALEKIGR